MKRLFLLLLLSGCATAPLSYTVAQRTEQLWAAVSTYGQPPAVEAITAPEMTTMRGPHVVATYRCNDRRILVLREQASDDDWLSGVIVHELTHHKQCIEGRLRGNLCPLEVEAYTAQVAWLNKRADELGFLAGTNARNYAQHVENHMKKHFSDCL